MLQRSHRSQTGRFLAEGPQAVGEALNRAERDRSTGRTGPGGGPPVIEVFATQAALARHPGLADTARRHGVPVSQLTDKAIGSLTETVHPQGIVAVCSALDLPLDRALRPVPRLAVVLADIRDPGNAGTVLRTADAAGAGAVVFAGEAVDPYNGKCVRASAGSLFHLPVVRGLTAGAATETLRHAGLQVLAADGSGEEDLDLLADAGALDRPTAWLFGNEAWGLPAQIAALADARVRIPIYGAAESLNLAAAAAVCLYASARAHRPHG